MGANLFNTSDFYTDIYDPLKDKLLNGHYSRYIKGDISRARDDMKGYWAAFKSNRHTAQTIIKYFNNKLKTYYRYIKYKNSR